MKRKSTLHQLMKYVPDASVLDEAVDFDDLSAPYFHKGNEIGCLVLHGIGGTPANVRLVADALAEKGYTVLSPILPGHGETVRALNRSTDAQWLDAVRAAYNQLKTEGCTRVLALGLSLGGVLSACLAIEEPLSGLALLCAPLEVQPFLRIGRRISRFLPFVRYPSDSESKAKRQPNPYEQMYDGFSTLKLVDLNRLCKHLRKNLNRITCPTLFMTAEYDDKVDPSSTDIWKQGAVNVPHTAYVHLEHSPHCCTYGPEREHVAAVCAQFVASVVDNAPLASV